MPRDGRVRQAAVDAAQALMADQGYAGTSLRDVAREVGVTVAALYYHFPAKEDLAAAVADRLLADLEDVVAAAEAGSSRRPLSPAATRSVLDAYLSVLLAHRAAALPLIADLTLARTTVGSRQRALRDRLRPLLVGGAADGDLVLNAAFGLLSRPLLLGEGDLDAHRDWLVAQCAAVLRSAPRPAPESVPVSPADRARTRPGRRAAGRPTAR